MARIADLNTVTTGYYNVLRIDWTSDYHRGRKPGEEWQNWSRSENYTVYFNSDGELVLKFPGTVFNILNPPGLLRLPYNATLNQARAKLDEIIAYPATPADVRAHAYELKALLVERSALIQAEWEKHAHRLEDLLQGWQIREGSLGEDIVVAINNLFWRIPHRYPVYEWSFSRSR
jgi:hypothetical protein